MKKVIAKSVEFTAEKSHWANQVIVSGVFAGLGLAALYFFVVFAEPPEWTHHIPFQVNYSEAPLMEALSGDGLERRLAEIMTAGMSNTTSRTVGRMSGSAGCDNTEKLILEAFRAAGLEVQTQEFRVVVPVTESCGIFDAAGRPLPDIQIYPLLPLGLTPTALPEEGLQGELVFVESLEWHCLAGHTPTNSIVLTTLNAPGSWSTLAALGVRALIVMEDQEEKQMRSDPDQAGAWPSPVAEEAFPRFLAQGPLADYVGQRLTLKCKVTWQERKARNLIGVLRGRPGADEALVLSSYYDSHSIVPELAPGAEQAIAPAVLLELVRALAPYRGQLRRDVVFIATAAHGQSLAGVTRLMEAIEDFARGHIRSLEELQREEELRLDYALHGLKVLEPFASGALNAVEARKRWLLEDPEFRRWFEHCVVTVAGEINLEHKDRMLERKLAYARAGKPVFRDGFDAARAGDAERKSSANVHPLLREFLEAQELDNRSGNLMALPFWQWGARPEFQSWNVVGRMRHYLEELVDYHRQQIKEIHDSLAIRALFAGYQRTLTLNLELTSGGIRQSKDLALMVGIHNIGSVVEPQVTELSRAIQAQIPVADNRPAFEVIQWGPLDAAGDKERPNPQSSYFAVLDSELWTICGRLAFSVLNYQFRPPKLCTPEDRLEGRELTALREQIAALGKAVLSIAQGRVVFKTIAPDRKKRIVTLGGTVYGNAGAQAMLANHRMGQATFVHAFVRNWMWGGVYGGIRTFPILKVNPYGEYFSKFNFNFVKKTGWWGYPITVNAARYGADGAIKYFKNASPASQTVFRNERIPNDDILVAGGRQAKPISIELFRCARVEFFDQSNPQTMKPFKRVDYLAWQGLSGPRDFQYNGSTALLPPDFTFYVGLLDGAADNEYLLIYRACMLNVDPQEPIGPAEPEIHGKGYLAADTPNLIYAQQEASESMLRTNAKRLRLQQSYGMADELMLAFQDHAREWLELAKKSRAANDSLGAVLSAGRSLAYAINNHPVIRKKIAHAVVGILWYLGLLVPFVFFFEKLVFGFTDIRKQLVAHGIIFLVVFSLLRLAHPAFQMVRSSLMILLGFVIFLLTLLVTLMVGGKFKQNIRELRSREGRVEGADINRGGVIGTAFLLGLNNMRRRKVRTGLTAVTLILITFIMICFTSVSTDLVNVEDAMGRSSWNGLLLQNPNFADLGAELNSIIQFYGQQYPITTHAWLTGSLAAERLQNAEIVMDREFEIHGQKVQKRAKVNAALQRPWNEPLFSGIDRRLLTRRGWFPRPPITRQEKKQALAGGYQDRKYVMLPDTVARELDITVEDVDAGAVTNLIIRGETYEALGILDTVALNKEIGMDGRSILPYDLNAVQTLGKNALGQAIVPEDVKRLQASQVMIVNSYPPVKWGNEQVITVACGILFPKAPYQLRSDGPTFPAIGFKEQRRQVLEYLERTGEGAYYAIDGISYYGTRTRKLTVEGLLELLIPILIAAFTVFNTMRGSVYERQGEIYVYNAVGIAPNHVFFMFMAEAMVYAVVGAMLGYLLSQGVGSLLTAFHLTGGMNMNYSSMETIYVSLAVMGAVLLSTLIPARNAAKLAAPSEIRSWIVPEAVGDVMAFNLPFTFTTHDRVAVISYFYRWLDANGEGSSGPFFCSPPQARLARESAEGKGGGLIPGVGATLWLQPYDVGVSQRLEIQLPTDPETQEYIARVRLTRLSGTAAAWQRTVKPFLGLLRKQFLNWRAATAADREAMFTEARGLLSKGEVELPMDA